MKSIKIIVPLAVALVSLLGNGLSGFAGTTQPVAVVSGVEVGPSANRPVALDESTPSEALPQPAAPNEPPASDVLPQPAAPDEPTPPEDLLQPVAPDVLTHTLQLNLLFMPMVSN